MAQAAHLARVPDEVVERRIYLIRGIKVMLDSDPARLYGVTTGNLNPAVRRKAERRPSDFMFQLTEEELQGLILQFARSSWAGAGSCHLPLQNMELRCFQRFSAANGRSK
jgi:hypothetical protein